MGLYKRIRTIGLVLLAGCLATPPVQAGRWVVYYNDEAPPKAFTGYDLVVFDSTDHPPVRAVRENGAEVLGYLSLGEVEAFRAHYEWAREAGILLQENENWPDSYMVDIRRQVWLEKVIYDLIPRLVHDGFDGVMLDTVDSPLWLERQSPETHDGMTEAAVRAIRAINANFPDLKIMLNRGYEILPQVAGNLDYVLGESVRSDYDFETDTYKRVAPELYRYQIARLKAAQDLNADLEVMTLDYWDPDDQETIRDIYATQRDNGFQPYVATVDLQRIVPEPPK